MSAMPVPTPWPRPAVPQMALHELHAAAPDFQRLPLATARRRGCVLLREGPLWLLVAADPLDADLRAFIDANVQAPVQPRSASAADIEAYLAVQEERVRSMEAVVSGDGDEARAVRGIEHLSLASIGDAASPAVRVVNSTLYDALRLGASDIHLESVGHGLVSRFRIDGVLETVAQVQGGALAEQVISRIKVLSELDIAERRVPQDGSFRVEAQGREIDLRVSIMPSIHGEDAVIRILDKKAVLEQGERLSLEVLGLRPGPLAALRRLACLPYGMVLVTGPTGSGKTTTLYGALSEINDGREKIVTIEDPVEYQLAGVLQIPVHAKKGLTFAKGLRSILRHDPDKIMVGEIRDRETAEIAIQSALTGHLVLSTLHANSVYDVFGRFQHMGVDLYSFVSALSGVSAQRLLRVVCTSCAEAVAPDAQALQSLGLDPGQLQGWQFRHGRGCPACRGSGYRGRKAAAQVLPMTPELAELVVERRPMRQIVQAGQLAGSVSLKDDALALVAAGETTLEEVARVTLA